MSLALFLLCSFALRSEPVRGPEPSPVLVELFTSEGCSSCPPADRVLRELSRTQPVKGARIVPLALHVDYWDRLGWKDPFASNDFTRRQEDYGQKMRLRTVYTPQMIVDGQVEFVGNDRKQAERAIAEAARAEKAQVEIKFDSSTRSDELIVRINIKRIPKLKNEESAVVVLAVTEDDLRSAVMRGENAGRKLDHSAVARIFEIAGELKPPADSIDLKKSIVLDGGWKRDHLNLVVFVQESQSRRVLGVGVTSLSRDE